jgi:hypothetical protein
LVAVGSTGQMIQASLASPAGPCHSERMDTVPYVLPLVVVLAVIAIWAALPKRKATPPYSKRPSLLTPGELRFYGVLLQAVRPGIAVFVKVRLMDVVAVPDNAWREYGAPGSGMHLDFVLADPVTLEVGLVIELDDKSHQGIEAQKRDALKDAALEAAGVPLLRVRAAGRYDQDDLKARIAAAL